jgi:hypothetical protein
MNAGFMVLLSVVSVCIVVYGIHSALKDKNTGITPLTPSEAQGTENTIYEEGYIHRCFVALDLFLNVIFKGQPDETISSRVGRAATEGKLWGILLSKFLNLFEKDHVAVSEAADTGRAEEVIKLEQESGNLDGK